MLVLSHKVNQLLLKSNSFEVLFASEDAFFAELLQLSVIKTTVNYTYIIDNQKLSTIIKLQHILLLSFKNYYKYLEVKKKNLHLQHKTKIKQKMRKFLFTLICITILSDLSAKAMSAKADMFNPDVNISNNTDNNICIIEEMRGPLLSR